MQQYPIWHNVSACPLLLNFNSWNSLRDFIESSSDKHIPLTTHIDILKRVTKLLVLGFKWSVSTIGTIGISND